MQTKRRKEFKRRIEFRATYTEDEERRKETKIFKEDFRDFYLSCLKDDINNTYKQIHKKRDN